MSGYLLHDGAQVLCAHGGTASPSTTNSNVTVSNQPTVLLSTPYTISGCGLPSNAGGPCATAQWTVGTTRVTSHGQPMVIMGGTATCVPTGTPLQTVSSQTRAQAT